MTAPRLWMAGIALRLGDTEVLGGVDFAAAAGTVHALLGENGAGKSSLMKVLVGVHRPDAGAMQLDGQPFAPTGPLAACRAGVAMIHQELSVLPHLSVADNVLLTRPARGLLLDRRARQRAARSALALLGHAELPLQVRTGRLPPAQRQLVEIARAIAGDARVLVMDEPTSSLGADDSERLHRVVDGLRERGVAVVFIGHALGEVRRLASAATVLRDGRTVATVALADCSDDQLVRHMAGRPLGELFPRRRPAAGPVVLEVEQLAAEPLPRRASLQLHAGEILGIGGLCGAGRSELLQALFGLRRRRHGHVHWAAAPAAATTAALWQAGVGFVAEDRQGEGLLLARPIGDNLVLPSAARLCRHGLLRPAAVRAAAAAWIAELGIRAASPAQPVGRLSGGNQQKVALARLLQSGSQVLLLDEPTRGIDVQSRQQIYAVLAARAAAGAAVLLVSSQLPELLGLCDRVAVMTAGVLGEARPAAQWTQESLLRAALGGAAGAA